MIGRVVLVAAVAFKALLSPASADFDAPAKPKLDCSNSANKGKPACRPGRGEAAIDELYNAAYWMARREEYQAALDFIGPGEIGDARLLTVRGYVLRKLGRIDEAVPEYLKALALDAQNVRTRQYLGEAYASQQRHDLAREQLFAIEAHCGRDCQEYATLAAVLGENSRVDR